MCPTVIHLCWALSAYAGRTPHVGVLTHTPVLTRVPTPSPEGDRRRNRDLFPLIQVCQYTLLIKQSFSLVSSPPSLSHMLSKTNILTGISKKNRRKVQTCDVMQVMRD